MGYTLTASQAATKLSLSSPILMKQFWINPLAKRYVSELEYFESVLLLRQGFWKTEESVKHRAGVGSVQRKNNCDI